MPVGVPNRCMKADGVQARGTARHSEGAAKTNHVAPAPAGTVDASFQRAWGFATTLLMIVDSPGNCCRNPAVMHTLNLRLTADSYVMAGPDVLVRHRTPTIGKPSKTATQRLRPPGLATSYTTIASADRRLGTTTADSCATRLVTSAVTLMQSLMKSEASCP
jgi:hypothetical protein